MLPPLDRRAFLRSAAALSVVPPLELLTGDVIRSADVARSARAGWDGYERALVIDFLASPGPFNLPGVQPMTDAMAANAVASGITGVNVTVSGGGQEPFAASVANIAEWLGRIDRWPDALLQVRTVADLERAKETGRLGLIFGFQDATALEQDLDRVALFQGLGVRIIQLTYNVRNLLGDGCLEPGNAGLSRWGHQVVERMDELGLIVDLSHCGQRTTADGIAASRNPVAISHSGCAALHPHPRSKHDAELRALAEKGGVIGIYLMPFLTHPRAPTTADVVAHIEHALQVCGEDHVGIGSDLSITPIDPTPEFWALHRSFIAQRKAAGIAAPGESPDMLFHVEELATPRRMERIADGLAARGHSDARIEKIIGGNFVRLMREVWG